MRRTAVIDGPGRILLAEHAVPDSKQLLVGVEYCGLCSSDLGKIFSQETPAGSGFGHEVAGVVVQPSSGYDAGQRVVVQTDVGCADTVATDPEHVLEVPTGLDLALAAMAEPVACALMAVERGCRQAPVDEVLLVGGGYMGLLAACLLRRNGVDVTILEPNEERLELAYEEGFKAIADDSALTRPFGSVFECVGSQAALDTASKWVATRGVLTIVGYHQSNGGVRTVDLRSWNYRGIDVINGHERDEARVRCAMSESLNLMANDQLPRSLVVGEVVPLADLPTAIHDQRPPLKRIVRCAGVSPVGRV